MNDNAQKETDPIAAAMPSTVDVATSEEEFNKKTEAFLELLSLKIGITRPADGNIPEQVLKDIKCDLAVITISDELRAYVTQDPEKLMPVVLGAIMFNAIRTFRSMFVNSKPTDFAACVAAMETMRAIFPADILMQAMGSLSLSIITQGTRRANEPANDVQQTKVEETETSEKVKQPEWGNKAPTC